ncbi:TetR family transcriptional regulator [Pseudovibrio flavus]|uniref:TetR family transcriptional regulator n=1 Tax=Pseudovibrio flavus TaxID=2529854 RepID=UPI00211C8EA6|nr:TetR family transcriptional regulator [Pseudovibrio flavus]
MSYLPKDAKRKAILDATLSLVVSCGFAGITARKVAAEMGAATGTIHHHFKSLDALKSEVVSYASEMAEEHDRQRIEGQSPLEALKTLLLPSKFPNREFENRVWLSAADEMWRNESLKDAYCRSMNWITDELETIIKRGIELGDFKPTLDARKCAWKFMATAFTISSYTYLGDDRLDLKTVDEIVMSDIETTLGITALNGS